MPNLNIELKQSKTALIGRCRLNGDIFSEKKLASKDDGFILVYKSN
jgi:hypothetical protein